MGRFNATADNAQRWPTQNAYSSSTTDRDLLDVPRGRAQFAAFLYSIVTASLSLVITAALYVAEVEIPWKWVPIVIIGLTVTAGATAAIMEWRGISREFMDIVKKLMLVDQNGNKIPDIYEPEEIKLTVIHNPNRYGYHEGNYFQKVRKEPLMLFARAMHGSKTGDFSQSGWVGKNLFKRAEFNEFRDHLIKANLAEWRGNDHNQGCRLTPDGLEIMRRLAAGENEEQK